MPNNNLRFFKAGLVFLFLFLLPTQLAKHFFVNFSYAAGVKVDYLAPAVYATDLLSLVLVSFFGQALIKKIRQHLFPLAIFILLFLLQITIVRYPLLQLYSLLKMVQLVSLFFIASQLTNERLILWAFIAGAVLQLGMAVGQLYTHASLQGLFYFLGERYLTILHPEVAKASLFGQVFLRPYGTFSHPNSLAGFYLLLYFYVLTNRKISQFVLTRGLTLLLFTLLIFLSFSKVAILTYLLLNACYFIGRQKIQCHFCLVAKITTTLVTAAIFLAAKTDPLSLEKRVSLLRDGILIFKNHFFLGVGLGHYLIYQAARPSKYAYFFLQPVHNIVILFFSQTGIIIGSILVWVLFKRFKREWKKPAFLLCFLAVLISGLFDHYWLTLQQNWLLLAVVFGRRD